MKQIKVCFVLPSLRAGGAERVISTLARSIDPSKFVVTIIVLGFEKDTKYKVENTKIIYLNKGRLIKSVFTLFITLKKIEPNIVMSSIGHVNQALAFFSYFLRDTKFIAREASVISVISNFSSSKISIPNNITSKLYQRFEKIVCQSSDMKQDLVSIYGIRNDNVQIINNPINLSFKIKKSKRINPDCPKFIAIGRLSPEKGQKRLLDVLSKYNGDFRFTILGDGYLKQELLEHIERLDLQEKVVFKSFSNQVNKILMNHDVFLQGSHVEGFPNALLEACTSGIPVIAYDAPGGTKEIVQNKTNGYLVNSAEEFIEKLKIAVHTEWNPDNIRESVETKFHPKIITEKYERLFEKLI